MSHDFIVTSATRQVIEKLFAELVEHVLNKLSLERRALVVLSLLYPTDSREYFIYCETIRSGFVPEPELLLRPIREAIKSVNPFAYSKFHCCTVGGVTVAGVRDAKRVSGVPRVMVVSVWAPDDISVQIAKRLAVYAPTLWEDVLVHVKKDLGI